MLDPALSLHPGDIQIQARSRQDTFACLKYHEKNQQCIGLVPCKAGEASFKESLGTVCIVLSDAEPPSLSFRSHPILFETFAYLFGKTKSKKHYRLAHLSRGNRKFAAKSTSQCLS